MSLSAIFKEHPYKLAFTLSLLLLEAGLSLLFPLFIGFAIDDAINSSYSGAIQLALLGVAVLLVGLGRRVIDSRFYASIYQQFGVQSMATLNNDQASIKSARLGMVRELIEFLENALPELISNIIGLVGVIVIIATLNIHVCYGSLLVALCIFLIYYTTGGKTISINKAYNDELEQQVDVLTTSNNDTLQLHLKSVMKWNIKLSDLEAINYSLSWLVLIVFLVAAIVIAIADGITSYGAVFALIMYVFTYIEAVAMLPLYYQHWLRLQEISERLKAVQ